MKNRKLLCLCDTPTVQTGFGRVAQALIARWKPHFERIDIYAINHDGDTPPPESPWAGPGIRLLRPRNPWYSVESLQRFLNFILAGDYTHVWIMQDLFLLSPNGFPGAFRKVCQAKGVRSLLYYPVDGTLDPEWTDFLRAVDVPVAYTQYGTTQALLALQMRTDPTGRETRPDGYDALLPRDQVTFQILPHGVNWEVFSPPDTSRHEMRSRLFSDQQFVGPDDYLIVNVNQNSRRKAMWSSLLLIQRLTSCRTPSGGRYRLLLHCPPVFDGIDLESVGRQLGLQMGVEWAHTGAMWTEHNRPQLGDHEIRNLFHAADLTLSTSLGEGWGMALTEALATGCPAAVPMSTSLAEIKMEMDRRMGIQHQGDSLIYQLPLANHPILSAESRLRYCVDPNAASIALWDRIAKQGQRRVWLRNHPDVMNWLSWDRIADEWIKLMNP